MAFDHDLILVVDIFQVLAFFGDCPQHFLALFVAEGVAVGKVDLVVSGKYKIEVQFGIVFFGLS